MTIKETPAVQPTFEIEYYRAAVHAELNAWFDPTPIPYSLTGADYMLLCEGEDE